MVGVAKNQPEAQLRTFLTDGRPPNMMDRTVAFSQEAKPQGVENGLENISNSNLMFAPGERYSSTPSTAQQPESKRLPVIDVDQVQTATDAPKPSF